MHANKRDAGLIRVVGVWTLAASIVSMIVGAGIFAVPAALAAAVGAYAPLTFLACGFAIAAVALCFAEGGSRLPTSGGVYGFVEAAFGPLVGYIGGTLLWVSCLLAAGGVTGALADLIASLLPWPTAGWVRIAVILVVLSPIVLVNVAGVAHGARLAGATTALKLVPLILFVVVGAGAVHAANFSHAAPPDAQSLGRALTLAVFSLLGMEGALCVSGEVREPNRTIPRALLIAVLLTTALYVAIQSVAQGILGSALASSKAPLADAMGSIHPLLRALMLAGTALSMFGWMSSDILGSPRQLFAFARDGQLPRLLGRVSPRRHVPYVAVLCYAAAAVVLAITGTFGELVVLATLGLAALYAAGCAAAWLLARRGVALAGPPLNFRYLSLAAAIGISGMLGLILLASRQEILGLMSLIALSGLVYLVQSRIAARQPALGS
ncbi:MAG: amino acid permease [Sinobacteraceae bacterium]|nr:amino acid permease [Nevskiaceae bacterium]